MSFRSTTYSSSYTSRGFRIIVDRSLEKVRFIFDSTKTDITKTIIKEWLDTVNERIGLGPLYPEPYWGFNDLKRQIGEKKFPPPLLNFITDVDVTCLNTKIKEQHISIYRKNKKELVLESTRTNYFNDNGTLHRIIETKNKEISRREYEYDSKGNLINVIFFTNDKEVLRHHYIYKKAPNCVEIEMFDLNDKDTPMRQTFNFKNNNTVVEKKLFITKDGIERLFIFDIYYLDTYGNIHEIHEMKMNWKDILMKHVYRYNKKNEMYEKAFYRFNVEYYAKVEVTYNDQSNPVELIYKDNNGMVTMKSIIDYTK
jgi:hypothetical protein